VRNGEGFQTVPGASLAQPTGRNETDQVFRAMKRFAGRQMAFDFMPTTLSLSNQ
jgi:hypothetical protein